jgi:hypothetical protein
MVWKLFKRAADTEERMMQVIVAVKTKKLEKLKTDCKALLSLLKVI